MHVMMNQDQKPQEQVDQTRKSWEQPKEIQEQPKVERPSHMNQGNQAFRPDQQKKQNPGEPSGQSLEDRARKAS
jgi:hypothetical protein